MIFYQVVGIFHDGEEHHDFFETEAAAILHAKFVSYRPRELGVICVYRCQTFPQENYSTRERVTWISS